MNVEKQPLPLEMHCDQSVDLYANGKGSVSSSDNPLSLPSVRIKESYSSARLDDQKMQKFLGALEE